MSANDKIGANRDLRNDLNWSIAEIQDLRRRVEKAETKALAFDAMEKVLNLNQGRECYAAGVEDVVWRLQTHIDNLNKMEEQLRSKEAMFDLDEFEARKMAAEGVRLDVNAQDYLAAQRRKMAADMDKYD